MEDTFWPGDVQTTTYDRIKRGFDVIVSLALLCVLSPLFLLIGALVKWGSGGRGPVFFGQVRIGQNTKPFTMLKFRTMVVDAEQWLARDPRLRERFFEAYKLRDDPRVTRVGRWLRKWSLDELPQLLNVLKGEMSLVGPRPTAEDEHSKFGPWGPRLLSVKPGLTGLWQVLRHDDLDYTRCISLDMYYIEHRSLRLDLAILLRTLPSVLARRGAY